MFGKLLYLQSIIIAELTKPIGKRAEWIVYVEDAPFLAGLDSHLHGIV